MNSNLKGNQELRAAMRKAYWPPGRLARVEEWAKQVSKTPEEFINMEIDAQIDDGWGEAFQDFQANHGRYPEHGETVQAAAEWKQKGGHIDVDLGSEEPSLKNKNRCSVCGKPLGWPSNPKAEFYEDELEVELNHLLEAVEISGNEQISEHVKRTIFIFHRVKDSRKEGAGKT